MTKFEKFSAFLVILLLVLFGYFIHQNIYIPSKMSVDFVCNNNYTSEELENHPNVLGYYNSSSDDTFIKTTITVNDTVYDLDEELIKKTIKHEYCHKHQEEQNRLNNNCGQRIRFVLDEMECNFSEYLPDKIYLFFYE